MKLEKYKQKDPQLQQKLAAFQTRFQARYPMLEKKIPKNISLIIENKAQQGEFEVKFLYMRNLPIELNSCGIHRIKIENISSKEATKIINLGELPNATSKINDDYFFVAFLGKYKKFPVQYAIQYEKETLTISLRLPITAFKDAFINEGLDYQESIDNLRNDIEITVKW